MPGADLILKNANVLTVDQVRPTASLVAVKSDRIVLVGENSDLESTKGPGSKIIDCQGRTVVPGFNDAHCHISSMVRKLLSIDLSPSSVRSIAEIKKILFMAAQNTPQGQWLLGTDYNDFYLDERRHPTRLDIDEIVPEHPVVLCHKSLHICVLNSYALGLAGISNDTEEPAGTTIERELDSGEPNGVLHEMLGYIRNEVMPPLSESELNDGIALANQHYLSQGLTSLQYASVGNDLNRWQELKDYKGAGKLKSRVSMMSGIGYLKQFQEAGLAFRSGNNQLRLGGVKIILTETSGRLYPPQDELNHLVLNAHRAGFQVAIHAIEMEAVEAAVNALEYVRKHYPKHGQRHRIEHCSECPPQLLERLKIIQAVVVTQPPFLHYSGERYLAMVATERQPWLYRIRSLLEGGLVVAGSSDSPVVPDNPLTGINAAVSRRAENGQPVVPEEAITAEQALEMYTVNAAYASFDEEEKGSITPGKLADMVVLSDDSTKVPTEEIKDIKVEMTVIGGEVVWGGVIL